MKVIYIPHPDLVSPWYDDFAAAVDGRYPVDLFDWEGPLNPQFSDVKVVVELGGTYGTREMVDVAIEAGVRLWQICGTGMDHVDVSYFLKKGLPLANIPGEFSSVAMAEHAMFLMLCLAKKYRESSDNLRQRIFYRPAGDELASATLGLIGFGASARELALRAASFGMKIMAVDVIEVPPHVLDRYRVGFFGDASATDLVLGAADYISLHLPLTSNTKHLIGSRELALMKRTAHLINVARGELIDEMALAAAVKSGQIRGAGLDVFAEEPVPLDHPLLQLDNVIATPHVGGGSCGTSRRRAKVAAENVDRVARGLPPLHQIMNNGS